VPVISNAQRLRGCRSFGPLEILFFRVFVRQKQLFEKLALANYLSSFSGACHKKIIKIDEN
jgi:hypothetical protein